MSGVPVLWLCGPSGVGKSTVGAELFARLVRAGVPAAFVDIDQLAMCYPEPADDPGRHRLAARNLDRVVAGHRAAGARCIVVSGVVDARHGVHRDELTGMRLTVCRLRADPDELARRLAGREGTADGLPAILEEAALLDGGRVADRCVDTTGRTVAEVCDDLADWPPPAEGGGRVLWLCGATGAGKSAAGFAAYLRLRAAGHPAAFLDVDQLGMAGPTPPGHDVRAAAVAAIWRNDRAAGAGILVMVGPAEDHAAVRRYAAALAGAALTVVRLHAGPATLAGRIERRGAGRGTWHQPGDPLRGRPAAELREVARRAAEQAAALDRAGLGHRIDTDDRTVDEVAEAVLAVFAGRFPPTA